MLGDLIDVLGVDHQKGSEIASGRTRIEEGSDLMRVDDIRSKLSKNLADFSDRLGATARRLVKTDHRRARLPDLSRERAFSLQTDDRDALAKLRALQRQIQNDTFETATIE
jgi:hypothetical protein